MTTGDKVAAAFFGSIFGTIAIVAIPNLYIAYQRSHQKRTMANMRTAATRHEAGKPMGILADDWGHPMQVRIRGHHYAIRAAGADGIFETGKPRGSFDPDDFDSDILFADGQFLQTPGGL